MELGKDKHRLVLWKMAVVVMQTRIRGKQEERKKEGEKGGGSVAKPLPRGLESLGPISGNAKK